MLTARQIETLQELITACRMKIKGGRGMHGTLRHRHIQAAPGTLDRARGESMYTAAGCRRGCTRSAVHGGRADNILNSDLPSRHRASDLLSRVAPIARAVAPAVRQPFCAGAQATQARDWVWRPDVPTTRLAPCCMMTEAIMKQPIRRRFGGDRAKALLHGHASAGRDPKVSRHVAQERGLYQACCRTQDEGTCSLIGSEAKPSTKRDAVGIRSRVGLADKA